MFPEEENMANIAFYAAHPEMMEQARNASESIRLQLSELKLVSTSEVVEEARRSAASGINIIIARGSQAAQIRQYTNIPVVDIVLTGQEIGLLIYKAKEILKSDHPVLGMVGFQNMFCDITFFDQIFGVTIKEYFASHSDELPAAVELAISDGAQLIIGGDKALQCAQKRGVPTLFLTSTQDSINEAFRVAKKLAYVSDLEQKNNAELSTLLDYSFNGIIKVDANGKVVVLNHIARDLIHKSGEQIIGTPIISLIHEITPDMLGEVLTKGGDIPSIFFVRNNAEVTANLAPIKVAGSIEGAILSCHEIKKVEEMGAKTRLELYRSGHAARQSFAHVGENSPRIRKVISRAQRYAYCDAPILIQGEPGTEKELFVQCIHNASARRTLAYIPVNCASMGDDGQNCLFGLTGEGTASKGCCGIFQTAQSGTLFLNHVDALSLKNQHRLFDMLQAGAALNAEDDIPSPVNMRVIAATSQDLYALSLEGKFYAELYYLLSTLTIGIPPLRERPEDAAYWVDLFFGRSCRQYSRYLTLTDDAKDMLAHYRWEGNLMQLESFCGRLTINASKRVLDSEFIKEELAAAYPPAPQRGSVEKSAVYKEPKAVELSTLMNQYSGNRALVAGELGISKTTLWRRLKKYNI